MYFVSFNQSENFINGHHVAYTLQGRQGNTQHKQRQNGEPQSNVLPHQVLMVTNLLQL
jgi:hypothetical protein